MQVGSALFQQREMQFFFVFIDSLASFVFWLVYAKSWSQGQAPVAAWIS
jgi:zona occludens toxin (predicted ATPase)